MDYQVWFFFPHPSMNMIANLDRTAQVPNSVAVVSPRAQRRMLTDESVSESLRWRLSTSTRTHTSSRITSAALNVACVLLYTRTMAHT